MDLAPSDEQTTLCDAASRWLNAHMPLAEARNRKPALFQDVADMGWIGMTAPAIGLDHASEALIFAEMGRHLAPLAALASAVAARWLGAPGKLALAVPDGNRLRLFDGEGAEQALGLWDNRAATIALPAGLAPREGLDPTTTLALLAPSPAPSAIGDPAAALHLQLLAAAFALGCAEAARDMAADYARLREQFGRPIGAYQAIKHICADMAVRAAVASAQLSYAACALDAGDADAGFHIAAAKRLADTAALDNARGNIQVHGGIGMTDTALPHLLLKRAHLLAFVAPVATPTLLTPFPET